MPDYPVFFTVTGAYKPFAGDGDNFQVNGDLTADVLFTPKIKRGGLIVGLNEDDDSSIGFVPTTVKALIDTDGLVKLRAKPDLPLRIMDSVGDFPDPGLTTRTYVAEDTGQHYLWDADAEEYVEIPSYIPLRLLAGLHLTGLDEELHYTVKFTKVQFNGVAGHLKGFTFRAPTSDISVSLVELQSASYEAAI